MIPLNGVEHVHFMRQQFAAKRRARHNTALHPTPGPVARASQPARVSANVRWASSTASGAETRYASRAIAVSDRTRLRGLTRFVSWEL